MRKQFLFGLLIGLVLCIVYSCDPTTITPKPDPVDTITPVDSSIVIDPEPIDTTEIPVIDSSAVYISFEGDTPTVNNPLKEEIDIRFEGNQVNIQSRAKIMNFVLSGEASNTAINIHSDSTFSLTLNNLSLSNQGPVISILSSTPCVVYLPDSTENLLDDQAPQMSAQACIVSNSALTFSGNGILTLKSTHNHAIVGKSSVRIQNGNYQLIAGKDGIHCQDYILIDNGSIDITSGDDGLQSESNYIRIKQGTIDIKAVGDGIAADSTSADKTSSVYIEGGTLHITTTGEKGMGITSDAHISIDGGDIHINLTGDASKALKSTLNTYINGGSLELITSGNGLYDDAASDISSAAGIKSDGNLYISGDSTFMTINSSGSAGKGINVSGNITIDGGRISVKTSGGEFIYGTLSSSGKAVKNDGNFVLNGGELNIEATGNGADAIDTEKAIYIKGGTCRAKAYDDAIKATTTLSITGGNVYAYSDQNDGLDAKAGIYISGGLVVSVGSPNTKKGGFETDGTLKITGGTVLAIGNKNTKPSSSVSTQYSASYTGRGTANTYYCIQDKDGKTLMTYLLPRTYSTLHLIYSCKEFVPSTSYSLYSGGSVSDGEDFNGYIIGGNYSGGSLLKTFSIGGLVTSF